MSFDRPLLLIPALILATLIAWMFARLWSARHRHDLVYSDVAFFQEAVGPSPPFMRAIAAAAAAALLLLCTSFAAPHVVLPVPAKDGAVVLCIDTSGSMASTDVSPTRAAAAVEAATAFIHSMPQGVKVGIIAFSTGAALVEPLTADHDGAVAALAQVPAPNGATAIGDALSLAGQTLGERGHRAIVLITDGVNNRGSDPDQAAETLGSRHVPIYTIGIGTNSGDVIPGTNEEATIDEDALQRYAQVSGGSYARAQDAAQLHDALARLGTTSTLEHRRIDATLGFALGGAALLIAAALCYLGMGRIE